MFKWENKGGINILRIREKDLKSIHDLELSYKDSILLKEHKKGDKLSILSDSMLKTMFQNENRMKYSAKLLSYYLDISFEELLENIHLSKNELDKLKEKKKGQRGDYIAEINGAMINIEVNNNGSLEILERNMEYAHRLYSRKVRKGKEEKEYTQVIQFNLNNFSFIGNNKIVDIYLIQNEEKIKLTDKLIYIQIFIPNLIRKWYTNGVQSLEESEKYLLTLVLPNIENSMEVGKGIKIMEEYIAEAKEVTEDDDLLEAYDKEVALMDLGEQKGFKAGESRGFIAGKEKGFKEGEEKGFKDGEEKGFKDGEEKGFKDGEKKGFKDGEKKGFEDGKKKSIKEISKKLLDEKVDLETILKVTGLSKKDLDL